MEVILIKILVMKASFKNLFLLFLYFEVVAQAKRWNFKNRTKCSNSYSRDHLMRFSLQRSSLVLGYQGENNQE
jgi:hypothetical protein